MKDLSSDDVIGGLRNTMLTVARACENLQTVDDDHARSLGYASAAEMLRRCLSDHAKALRETVGLFVRSFAEVILTKKEAEAIRRYCLDREEGMHCNLIQGGFTDDEAKTLVTKIGERG